MISPNQIRATHSYVIMELSQAAYLEIKNAMLTAGYDHALNGGIIDMHGIAVVERIAEPGAPPQTACTKIFGEWA